MTKKTAAAAALGALCALHSAEAQAQSSVTLYGLLDANVQSLRTNGAGSGSQAGTIQNARVPKVNSGGLSGARWGIRVTEDLGGGIAAVARLETGFSVDTGAGLQGGAAFGRQANVGISANGIGTFLVGLNTSPYGDVSADHATMETSVFDPSNINNGNSAAAAATLVNAATATARVAAAVPFLAARNTSWLGHASRFGNSLKYTSPNLDGLTASLLYAYGEDKSANFQASRTISAALRYAKGPFLVSGGFQSEGVTQTGPNAPKFENALISTAYDFGAFRVATGFNRAQYKDVAPGRSLDAQKEFNLSIAVPFGATVVSAGYAFSRGDFFGTAKGYGIQAVHALSKRTQVYAGAGSTSAYSGLAQLVRTTSPASHPGNTTTLGVGMRHAF